MGGYIVKTSSQADDDLKAYEKAGNKVAIERIKRIFKELAAHPKTGIGKPEKLKHDKQKRWSRRVDDKNRMTYQIHENIVTVDVLTAMGHYDDK